MLLQRAYNPWARPKLRATRINVISAQRAGLFVACAKALRAGSFKILPMFAKRVNHVWF